MAFLKVFTNGDERTVFLGEEPIVIGRGEDCDVLLKDAKVSREHCVFEPCEGGHWRVLDLRSGNGTKVNGKKIRAGHVLEPEDVVSVGDAKVLFAGEAAAVVGDAPPAPASEKSPPARARTPRRSAARSSSKTPLLLAGAALVGVAILFVVFQSVGGGGGGPTAEDLDFRAFLSAETDAERVRLAEAYLGAHPESSHTGDVRRDLKAARERLREGTSARHDGFAPLDGLEGEPAREVVAALEAMLEEVPAEHKPAVREALATWRGKLRAEREDFFAEIERTVDELVEKGRFARAREMWFFLRGEPNWEPIPGEFLNRIVAANEAIENAAAAARNRLLEEEARYEAAHDFATAKRMLVEALPRFKGTSVERSLRERLEVVEKAIRHGVKTPATKRPVITLDVEKKLRGQLARLAQRDFAGAAAGLKALAEEAREAKDPAYGTIVARARECAAAAALHDAMVAALAKPPKTRIARKWRVLAGDADGVTVRTKGEERTIQWRDVPSPLHVALLERAVPGTKLGHLGLAVATHAVDPDSLMQVLAKGYEAEGARGLLDEFVAARVRDEPMPEGGYVVSAGELFSRKEYLRREEEALIARLKTELDEAYASILANKALKKLERLKKRKDELDRARAHALELIYDEKKYFYPYRGTGRMGEYTKVQQEVDRRVEAVRELWDDPLLVSIKAGSEITKALERFDHAVAELEKRLVDVEEKKVEVDFLRAYSGQRFTVRTFFRNADELELLRYGDEVMEFNEKLEGDITDVEREQVRITNEYRKMFGRWPVRLVEKLVLSSRGHCEEMSRLGYFGHFSPTPGRRTPYDRMKLQGYDYGSSENCIMGRTGPKAAHDGWCHSSGHHRNLLMAPWTEMGTGHHGRYMTQNFGQAPKWSKDDPAPAEEAEDDPDFEWEDDGCSWLEGCGCEPGKAPPPDDDEEDFDYEEDGE